MASRPSKLRRQEERWAYLFLLPQYLGLLCFVLGPVVVTLFLSFSEWNLVAPPRWIGLQNYQVSFQTDVFWQTWRNTIYYVIATVAGSIVFSLALALALNEKLRGITLYRGIYFLPVVTSAVAVSMVWRWLYNPEFGLFNAVLTTIGLPTLPWLNSLKWAMPSVIIMSIWQTVGYNMVIFLAGLQGIADQFYEAAEMDGATAWQKFRHITLPLLSPTTFFVIIILLINSFQVFDQVWIMTEGGPAGATTVLVEQIVKNAFAYSRMGYAAALSWVLFALVFVVTLLQNWLQRNWVTYE